eukprot:GHVS01074016.1.p1 GENE.GHVS01074016.1~~GHVS01074016.1.p1  ORF type:complete len:115 (+),score=15.03 GHVS01074016.1:188-532(+)
MDSSDNQFFKERPSTKVHAAPGGNSSIVFGDHVDPGRGPVHATAAETRLAHSNQMSMKAAGNSGQMECSKKKMVQPGTVLQPDAQQKAAGMDAPHRTSVRVRQPPGGNTSFTLG